MTVVQLEIPLTDSQADAVFKLWQKRGSAGGAVICQPTWPRESKKIVMKCAVLSAEDALIVNGLLASMKKQKREDKK